MLSYNLCKPFQGKLSPAFQREFQQITNSNDLNISFFLRKLSAKGKSGAQIAHALQIYIFFTFLWCLNVCKRSIDFFLFCKEKLTTRSDSGHRVSVEHVTFRVRLQCSRNLKSQEYALENKILAIRSITLCLVYTPSSWSAWTSLPEVMETEKPPDRDREACLQIVFL